MRKWLSRIRRREDGVALLIVMVMMTAGSLMIVPTLSYVTTGIQTGEMYQQKMKALYAADAGVEDGIWRMTDDRPETFPHTSQLTNVNGLTVDVTIAEVTTVGGKDVGTGGVHDDYLDIIKTVTYDSVAGVYTYTLSVTNNGTGNVKVEMILIDLPPGVSYLTGTTSGDLYNGDPTVIGNASTGEIVFWEFTPPYPTIPEGATRVHTFQMGGPPNVAGVEGHGCVRATRQDVGTVWDTDSRPYSITAEARNASNEVVATIKVGLWEGATGVSIAGWQVSP